MQDDQDSDIMSGKVSSIDPLLRVGAVCLMDVALPGKRPTPLPTGLQARGECSTFCGRSMFADLRKPVLGPEHSPPAIETIARRRTSALTDRCKRIARCAADIRELVIRVVPSDRERERSFFLAWNRAVQWRAYELLFRDEANAVAGASTAGSRSGRPVEQDGSHGPRDEALEAVDSLQRAYSDLSTVFSRIAADAALSKDGLKELKELKELMGRCEAWLGQRVHIATGAQEALSRFEEAFAGARSKLLAADRKRSGDREGGTEVGTATATATGRDGGRGGEDREARVERDSDRSGKESERLAHSEKEAVRRGRGGPDSSLWSERIAGGTVDPEAAAKRKEKNAPPRSTAVDPGVASHGPGANDKGKSREVVAANTCTGEEEEGDDDDSEYDQLVDEDPQVSLWSARASSALPPFLSPCIALRVMADGCFASSPFLLTPNGALAIVARPRA